MKAILFILLLGPASQAYVDRACMDDCDARGSTPLFCMKQCEVSLGQPAQQMPTYANPQPVNYMRNDGTMGVRIQTPAEILNKRQQDLGY